ncbi:ABC transporter ATP-binding protein [Candidatus Micrarchaeota archaeon]|nr:ABC transporter ATP-binding protein [Candidatus Micrarchaeota archaeon]
MLEAQGLVKRFGSIVAVDGVSFKAKSGQVFGIAGPNGAGKSTIVRMLATILSPTEGTAIVDGLDIRENAESVRKLLGYLPEEPRVYDYMTGESFLEFFSDLYRVPRAERRVRSLLEFVGLEEHAHRKIGDYSKGMKQRISIARALVHDPQVLFLDEPTMGLDPASARELREKILSMGREGKTILVCTHYMDEADFLCDQLAILHKGKIAAIGRPEELKAKIAKKRILAVVLKEESKPEEKRFASLLSGRVSGRSVLVPYHDSSTLSSVHRAARKTGASIVSVHHVDPSLDDVFISVTRKRR